MKLLPSIIKNQDVQFCWPWKLRMQSSYILGGEMEHKEEWMATVGHSPQWLAMYPFLLGLRREPLLSLGLLEAVLAQGGDLDGASLQIKSDPPAPWKQRCNKLFS